MIDTSRHDQVFSARQWEDRRVDVIGAGSIGSRLVLELAKLGVTNLHVWDDDTVAEHNLANQLYGQADVGLQKAPVLYDNIAYLHCKACHPHTEKCYSLQDCGSVVFLAVDTMAARKELFETGRNKDLIIDTRMGTDQGRVYAIEPQRISHWRGYQATLCDDDEVTEGGDGCGSRQTVGATAGILSGFALWAFIEWFRYVRGLRTKGPNQEVLISAHPPQILTRRF